MSVFDLFRGFFGVPGGHYRGRRDPFFDSMTHDDDEEEEDEDDGVFFDGFRGDHQDPFDSAWRFGFSFGPDGMRLQEPPVFGQVLREMEEIFSQLGHWEGQSPSGGSGVPSIMPPPPPQEGSEKSAGRSSRNQLRDFMLKSPDVDAGQLPGGSPRDGRPSESPDVFSRSPHHGWTPFSKFHDIWRQERPSVPEAGIKGDVDLDSLVQSGGLDQILSPPAGQTPGQPRPRSFFQSVIVTKTVKPDGTVEERRTVRDGQGNEETTVTRSGGPGALQDPDRHTPPPLLPGGPRHFSDLRDDDSLFSKFFGGFK